MLYTGPWQDAIVPLDTAQQFAIATLALCETADRPVSVHRAGPVDGALPFSSDLPVQSYWIGVRADGDIRAVLASKAIYARRGRGSTAATTMQIALWVDPRWRRRGMGQALLQQCISASRHAGVRQLVLNGLDNDEPMRKLIRRFPADVVFACGTCQAWLELGAVAPAVAMPVLAS